MPISVYRTAWWLWIAWFLVLETLALLDRRPGNTLTETIRPLFHTHPLTWFLGAGLLCWMAVHFLAPQAEDWISKLGR